MTLEEHLHPPRCRRPPATARATPRRRGGARISGCRSWRRSSTSAPRSSRRPRRGGAAALLRAALPKGNIQHSTGLLQQLQISQHSRIRVLERARQPQSDTCDCRGASWLRGDPVAAARGQGGRAQVDARATATAGRRSSVAAGGGHFGKRCASVCAGAGAASEQTFWKRAVKAGAHAAAGRHLFVRAPRRDAAPRGRHGQCTRSVPTPWNDKG
jgi:hypothetical protein